MAMIIAVDATFEIMGLVAAFGIAYRLAEKYGVDALSAGAISLAAFLLATPYKVPFLPSGAKEEIMVGGGIPLSLMGSKGLFVAMIIAMLSTEIYRLIIQRNFAFEPLRLSGFRRDFPQESRAASPVQRLQCYEGFQTASLRQLNAHPRSER